MKWGIFILLWFISFSVFSQWLPKINRSTWEIDNIYNTNDNIVYIDKKGDIIINDGNYISGGDTSLVLWFDSKNVTKSGLTYNSTGDTIVWASNDTVVVDSTDHVVIGNSIRFGDPESGTIYTILDTLGSIDSIKLDQICTANIGDEFFVGCDGLIVDQSIYGDNGTQTTGAYQPMGIWIETDSSCWYYDGINDYIILPNLTSYFSGKATFSLYVKLKNNVPTTIAKSGLCYLGTSPSTHYPYTSGTIYMDIFRNDRPTIGTGSVNKSNWHLLTITNEPGIDNWIVYQNLNSIYSATGENSIYIPSTTFIGRNNNGTVNLNGYIDEIRIYNRALSSNEITNLYQSSKHYNP